MVNLAKDKGFVFKAKEMMLYIFVLIVGELIVNYKKDLLINIFDYKN